ncbi:MAG: DUF2284 domain-containing protein [Oscillospiraceae bacterium]
MNLHTITFQPDNIAVQAESGTTVLQAQIAAGLHPDAPCRFPDKQIASMEAYGMLVLEICKSNGLQYYYGADKMAYTSCFLL